MLAGETPHKFFPVKFAKCLGIRTSFDKTPLDDCFWRLSADFENFFRKPMGNCLFHVQVAEFQSPDTVKSYFTSAFQAFYIRPRSSYSKASIYLKCLKIICEEVTICNELRDANLKV